MTKLSQKKTQLLRITLVVLGTLGLFVFSHLLRQSINPSNIPDVVRHERIVALSPSTVEIVYQLGLDDRLVGVSRFSSYPPEASEKLVVGGYLDLDFEALLRLKPDCVILLDEQKSVADKLNELGIKSITVDHASTDGILSSIQIMGDTFGKSVEAEKILTNIQERIQRVTSRAENASSKPSVLVCISRDTTSSHPDRIIAAGNAGVHQEYITMAGGVNAYQGSISFPTISREKLLHLNPDIIIELMTEETWKATSKEKLIQQWGTYSELKAVRENNIIFLHEDKHLIPGPRLADTLEAFADAIHP